MGGPSRAGYREAEKRRRAQRDALRTRGGVVDLAEWRAALRTVAAVEGLLHEPPWLKSVQLAPAADVGFELRVTMLWQRIHLGRSRRPRRTRRPSFAVTRPRRASKRPTPMRESGTCSPSAHRRARGGPGDARARVGERAEAGAVELNPDPRQALHRVLGRREQGPGCGRADRQDRAVPVELELAPGAHVASRGGRRSRSRPARREAPGSRRRSRRRLASGPAASDP
jgi:hypothetical protein